MIHRIIGVVGLYQNGHVVQTVSFKTKNLVHANASHLVAAPEDAPIALAARDFKPHARCLVFRRILRSGNFEEIEKPVEASLRLRIAAGERRVNVVAKGDDEPRSIVLVVHRVRAVG